MRVDRRGPCYNNAYMQHITGSARYSTRESTMLAFTEKSGLFIYELDSPPGARGNLSQLSRRALFFFFVAYRSVHKEGSRAVFLLGEG